ncbi:MAG: hypothetical protein AB7T27_09635 [Kiritimatiellia bacterium]
MKIQNTLFGIIISLFAALSIPAEDITTSKGKTYINARITRVEPDGISFSHAGGIAKIPFWELPEEIQKKYGYDPQKAAAYSRQSSQAQAAYLKKVQSQPTDLEKRAKQFESAEASAGDSSDQTDSSSSETSSKVPPPSSNKTYTGADIYRNMFDLEGKVIKIGFPRANARQESKEYYSANYGSGVTVAVVLIPADIGHKWYKKGGKSPPSSLYVLVSTGTLVNEYGAKETGPVLTAVGTSWITRMGGRSSYSW